MKLNVPIVLATLLSFYHISALFEGELPNLVEVFEPALPTELLSRVTDDLERVNNWQILQHSTLLHGKLRTFWHPILSTPRTNIEQAIHHLWQYAYVSLSENDRRRVTGAEWWFQTRNGSEGIGFHYDKDEGTASLHGIMRFPMRGTITYLTDYGAPTVILNQTTVDGNVENPVIPHTGYIAYPKKNRHVIFRSATRLVLLYLIHIILLHSYTLHCCTHTYNTPYTAALISFDLYCVTMLNSLLNS
jgi:hypothetical protein